MQHNNATNGRTSTIETIPMLMFKNVVGGIERAKEILEYVAASLGPPKALIASFTTIDIRKTSLKGYLAFTQVLAFCEHNKLTGQALVQYYNSHVNVRKDKKETIHGDKRRPPPPPKEKSQLERNITTLKEATQEPSAPTPIQRDVTQREIFVNHIWNETCKLVIDHTSDEIIENVFAIQLPMFLVPREHIDKYTPSELEKIKLELVKLVDQVYNIIDKHSSPTINNSEKTKREWSYLIIQILLGNLTVNVELDKLFPEEEFGILLFDQDIKRKMTKWILAKIDPLSLSRIMSAVRDGGKITPEQKKQQEMNILNGAKNELTKVIKKMEELDMDTTEIKSRLDNQQDKKEDDPSDPTINFNFYNNLNHEKKKSIIAKDEANEVIVGSNKIEEKKTISPENAIGGFEFKNLSEATATKMNNATSIEEIISLLKPLVPKNIKIEIGRKS